VVVVNDLAEVHGAVNADVDEMVEAGELLMMRRFSFVHFLVDIWRLSMPIPVNPNTDNGFIMPRRSKTGANFVYFPIFVVVIGIFMFLS